MPGYLLLIAHLGSEKLVARGHHTGHGWTTAVTSSAPPSPAATPSAPVCYPHAARSFYKYLSVKPPSVLCSKPFHGSSVTAKAKILRRPMRPARSAPVPSAAPSLFLTLLPQDLGTAVPAAWNALPLDPARLPYSVSPPGSPPTTSSRCPTQGSAQAPSSPSPAFFFPMALPPPDTKLCVVVFIPLLIISPDRKKVSSPRQGLVSTHAHSLPPSPVPNTQQVLEKLQLSLQPRIQAGVREHQRRGGEVGNGADPERQGQQTLRVVGSHGRVWTKAWTCSSTFSEPRPPPAPQPDSESPDTQASLSSAPGVHFHKRSAPHPVLSGNGDTVVTTTTQVLPSQDSQSRWGDRPPPRL